LSDPDAAGPGRTPLTAVHERLGATLTDFAGWLMPLRYGSETAEHTAVRTAAGLFDLSHMGEIAVTGPDAAAALDYALTGDLSGLAPGRARYTLICAPDGGVLDDLIVYRLGGEDFLVVANASNAARVHGELAERAAGRSATVTDQTADYALIALQGPAAAAILATLTDADLAALRYYAGHPASVDGRTVMLARTGYTGEDGFEIFARPDDAEPLWATLTEAGAGHGLVPAGLAARDTLRLEAGMALYGNELGPDITPFEAGLGRVVKFTKPGGSSAGTRWPGPPRPAAAGADRAGRRVPPGAQARVRRPVGRPAVRHRDQRRAVADPGRADRHGLPRAGGGPAGRRRRGRLRAAGRGCPWPRGARPGRPAPFYRRPP
jgi:aminomethyltransferase